jgi:hypothetical protein
MVSRDGELLSLPSQEWQHYSIITQQLRMSYSCWKPMNKTAGFSKMGPCYTDRIQQHKCGMNSLVIALFPKTGGLLSQQYQEYKTSVFTGFWKIVHRQQPTYIRETKQNIQLCIPSITEQTPRWVA